ncbi:hypothetical protein SAMN04487891_101183 [Flagellimonas taeanensis]|uniref:Uncharacterized protein n=1 Tax=Flagellimonas taeanensis TaxID=1005926 RepID=A0A1M6PHL9_9FLAO|nr:hypothetical protein SAMN04487891_101183 [Allomuricauda taeanensis]SHK07410.1 hypothetical protein SAMN05216293_0186 [Allomuricauda taeanensis]
MRSVMGMFDSLSYIFFKKKRSIVVYIYRYRSIISKFENLKRLKKHTKMGQIITL